MINLSSFVRSLNGKPVAVFGLGLSGIASAKALMKGGAEVVAWDDNDERRAFAEKENIPVLNFIATGLTGYAALVLAPGVPLHFPTPHPAAARAREAGIEIIGDLEILHSANHDLETVGITGTNGKSTTTALIAHVLQAAGRESIAAGNIGVPVLEMPLPKKDGVIVLEISSYQMDLCSTFRPDISILLNISPDHIERHGSIDNYAAAKERIFEGNGVAICSVDDAYCAAIFEKLKNGARKAIPISVKKEVAGGVYSKDNILFDHLGTEKIEIGKISDIAFLPGLHNQQNICASYAALRMLGLNAEEILEHIKTYPGLPHRQFLARVINGVSYINDSKATNAEAATTALSCYHNIYWIVGGRAKEGGLHGVEPYVDRIRHAYVIGEAMEDIAKWLHKAGIPYTKSISLDMAVLEAHRTAQNNRGEPGPAGTVLLSPACSSFDQFRNFEHRGETFTALVESLSEDVDA